jgi:peptide/nickel transport system permease protein
MVAYVIRRLLLLPVVIFGVSILIFALLSLLSPYKRLSAYVDENMMSHLGSQEEWDVLLHQYGLDRPIHVQYWRWLQGLFAGDLGYSRSAQMPVSDALAKYFPASVELTVLAVIPVVLFAVRMGFFSAAHPNTLADHATRGMAIVGWSLPTFVAGLLLLLVFYGFIPWFPPGRVSPEFIRVFRGRDFMHYTNILVVDSLANGRFDLFLDALRHLVLPVVTLSFVSWALIMRVARSSLLNELRQDYVTTARAKGLKETGVLRHAKRNSMISVTTLAGMTVAGLLNGVVITESIFNYPGVGRFMATAGITLDAPAVLGAAILNGAIMVITNLVVDIMYTALDPRIRLD